MKTFLNTLFLIFALTASLSAQHYFYEDDIEPDPIQLHGFAPGEVIRLIATVKENTPAGIEIFREIHKLNADSFGNVSFTPGSGTVQTKRSTWSSNNHTVYFLQYEIFSAQTAKSCSAITVAQISKDQFFAILHFENIQTNERAGSEIASMNYSGR